MRAFPGLALLWVLILLPQWAAAQTPAGATFPPTADDSAKFVALNVHFVQDYLGGGNFKPQDDTTTHQRDEDGYRWAQGLVWSMNWPQGWSANPPMALYTGAAPPPAYPKRIQFVLTGVYFDRLPRGADSTHQYYYYLERPKRFYSNAGDDWVYQHYGRDKGRAINLIVLNQGYFFYDDWREHVGDHHPRFDGGVMIRNDCIKVMSPWFKSQGGGPNGNGCGGPWEFANIVSHEIGHALGLPHTWAGNDGCADTPDQSSTPPNFNCWSANSGECARRGIPASNNMMDYNGCQCALTPCQLHVIHHNLATTLRPLVRRVGRSDCPPVAAFCDVPPRVGRHPRHLYIDGSASFNETAYDLRINAVQAVGSADSLTDEPGWHRSHNESLDSERPTPYGTGVLDLMTQPGLTLRPNRVYRLRLRVWHGCDPAGAQEVVTWFDTYRARRQPPTVQLRANTNASSTEKTGR